MDNKRRRKLNEDWWEGGTEGKFDVTPPKCAEDIRPCDLVVCMRCNVQVWVGDLELERLAPGLIFGREVEGIYCPNCDQLIFDKTSWTAHMKKQWAWDEQQKPKRKGR